MHPREFDLECIDLASPLTPPALSHETAPVDLDSPIGQKAPSPVVQSVDSLALLVGHQAPGHPA